MDSMGFYTVLYRNSQTGRLAEPLAFQCWAEDTEHAEEQCLDAERDMNPVIIWTHSSSEEHEVSEAYDCWWKWGRK